MGPRPDEHPGSLSRRRARAVVSPASKINGGRRAEDVVPPADEEGRHVHLVEMRRHPDRVPEAIPERMSDHVFPAPHVSWLTSFHRLRVTQRQVPEELAETIG